MMIFDNLWPDRVALNYLYIGLHQFRIYVHYTFIQCTTVCDLDTVKPAMSSHPCDTEKVAF